MTGPRCIDCKFFTVALMGSNPEVLGECHRYPPQSRSRHAGDVAYFPFVSETDWCGEFKPAPGQQAAQEETVPVRDQAEMIGL